MAMWVKKNSSDWVDVKNVWVKRTPTSWVTAKKIWIKNASSIWSQFWPEAGPYPEQDLELTASRTTYPASGTSYPILTARVYHFDFDGSLTLKYKWSASATASGPWTDISGYTTYQTYSPGNPSSGSSNTIPITPTLAEYISGRVYFKFTMQATDASGIATREVVSEPITVNAPIWNTEPVFTGTPAVGYTFKWKVGKAYIGGVSTNVGYKTTIYRTNDNGVTKQYLYGTALEPDFSFVDNYEYTFNATAQDSGYTYFASTYSVFSDANGEKENATRTSIISDNKTVASPPGAFSITSATKGRHNGTTRPITVTWTSSQHATSYEFSIDSSSDGIDWIDRVNYGPGGASTPPTISRTFNIGSTARYIRVTIRSTNSSGLYAYTATVLATGQPPTAPVITSATSSTIAVTLNFTAPTDNGSADSIVYGYSYKTTASSVWSNYTYAISAPSTSYTVQNLVSDTSYDFKIRATNSDGEVSPDSNIFTFSTKVAPGPITNVFAKTFDSGYITTFFTTGTNTSNVELEYYFFQTQPAIGDFKYVDVPVSSSLSYTGTNTEALLYPDELYNLVLTASNGSGISTDREVLDFTIPSGTDKPTSSTPTVSNVTGTGFEANFTLSGSVNSIIIDVKTGGSSVSGYPKTIAVSDTSGGTSSATSTIVDLSPRTNYTFYVTPQYVSSTHQSFVYNGVQKSVSVGTTYSFSMGDIIYPSTNGHVGLTSGSSVYLAPPSSGYHVLVHLADFVQRQGAGGNGSGQLFYWSNDNQYTIRWNGFLLGYEDVGTRRLAYQIHFYKDLGYYDIKYINVGSSLYSTDAANAAPGLYINGTLKSNGTTLPFPWFISTGQTYRVYYNGTAPTASIAFTEIAQSDMIDAGAVTNGSSDDGYTVITTAKDKYVLPTATIGTITAGETTLSIPLTGTFTKYDYNVRTTSHDGTSVKSGTDATSGTLSITGLTSGTAYYISVTPKNTYGQAGTVVQDTKTTSALYTVTFDANGGTGAANPTSITQTTVGGSVTLAAVGTLAKTNTAFGGWNTKADGTGTDYAASTTYTPTSNIPLYAKWIPLYLVSFDRNNGGGTAPTALRQTSAGGSVALPGKGDMTAPTATPNFSGWRTSGGTTTLTGNYTPTANVTLYAYWTAATSFTVTFKANFTPSAPADTSQTANTTTALTANAFTRTGFTFSKWTTAANGTGTSYNDKANYAFTSDLTLYAQWTAILPKAPTGLSVTKSVGSPFMSTSLSPSASGNATKTQTWSFGQNTTFTINFTRGADATSSELYYSTSSATPESTVSQNGGTSTSASGSFTRVESASSTSNNDYTVSFWVRSITATDKSNWTFAGNANVDTPAYSAFELRLYRTNINNANFATATPSRNDLTYTWAGVNTSFAHQAQIRLTFDGVQLIRSS